MNLRRARIILLAALALLIPLRAAAGDGSGSLSVSASLGGCGVATGGVVCEINASFNPVGDAEYYTATVTLADSSVHSFGTVGPGGGSFYVPYVGAGVYRVEITAWGYDEDGTPEEIESDTGRATGDETPPSPDGDQQPSAPEPELSEPSGETEEPAPTAEGDDGATETPDTPAEPAETDPATTDCTPTNPDGTPRTLDPAVCPQAAPASAAEPQPDAAG